MDEQIEKGVREVLAAEQFGVLAASADGRLHTSTILFAETPSWELIHAIRPATLKAQLAYASPEVAFQVDNRQVVAADRSGFARIGFEGVLRRVPRSDHEWQRYHDRYVEKFPMGAALLQNPEVELHVLTPWTLRVAFGAHAAEDIAVPLPSPAPEPAGVERPAG